MSIDACVVAKSTSTCAWVALVVFVVSTVLLDLYNPKNMIRERLKDKYFSTDMTPGYSPAKLFTMLDLYAPEDFVAHKRFLSRHDLIYPLLYGFSSLIMLAYLQGALAPGDTHRIKYLWAIPLGAMLFDYLENGSMYLIVNSYDKNSPPTTLAIFSTVMTTFKLLFITVTLVLLLTGAVGLLLKKVWHLQL